MKPRYRVGSVTGWKISDTTNRANGSRHVPASFYYVHDTADAYRIVREFVGRTHGQKPPAERAQDLADELNTAEDAWLAERGLR
jgi:DUF1365 family protein